MNPLYIFLIVFGGLAGLLAIVFAVVMFFTTRFGPLAWPVVYLAGTGAILGSSVGVILDYPLWGLSVAVGTLVLVGVLRLATTDPTLPVDSPVTGAMFTERWKDVLGRNWFGLAIHNFTVSAGSLALIVVIIGGFAVVRAGTRSSPTSMESFFENPLLWKESPSVGLL